MRPAALILVGFIILFVSWATILLAVIHVLPQSFGLYFGAYAASFAGFLMGIAGLVAFRRER